MNKIRLIIWREYITRVRKPSFLVMTILGPLLIVGAVIGMVALTLQESGPQKILVIDVTGVLFVDQLKPNQDLEISYDYSPVDIPDTVFKNSAYTLMVRPFEKVLENNGVVCWYKEVPSQMIQNYVSSDLERVLRLAKLSSKGYDKDEYDKVSKPLAFKILDIDENGKDTFQEARAWLGFAFGYMIFFFIFLYGVQVMRGVMEEKQSRIVEVLVSSVKPFQLMMGKIIGIAAVGLTQFLLWVGITTVLFLVGFGVAQDKFLTAAQQTQGQMTVQLEHEQAQQPPMAIDLQKNAKRLGDIQQFVRDLPITGMVLLFVFYFLGGYLLYSSLFAAVGAAVDAEADTQQFMLPITIPMMLAIFIAQTAVYNPDGPAVFWTSIIPLTSPVVMMIRIATGNAFDHPWHLVLSMSLLVATFIFTTWLAGRIYRTGILMYGKKVTWKELGKWLFYRG